MTIPENKIYPRTGDKETIIYNCYEYERTSSN